MKSNRCMSKKIILFADIYESFSELDSRLKQEWESRASIEYLMEVLKILDYEVELIEPKINLEFFLSNLKSYSRENTIFFNLVEGYTSRNREGYIPSLAEFLGFPYIGSDAYTMAISLDKFLTKKIAKELSIPTLDSKKWNLNSPEIFETTFPVFLKPNSEGSSLGIHSENICRNQEELDVVSKKLLSQFFEIISEPYLSGYDLTVGVFGNYDSYAPTKVARIEYKTSVYDEKIKSKSEMPEKLFFDLDKTIELEIQRYSISLCSELKVNGYARLDWKLDEFGKPFFLEINATPGLSFYYSSLPICYQHSFGDYTSMIQMLIDLSLIRYKQDLSFDYGKFSKK
jgi:D-alanine-D-alanine ligase